MILCSDLLVNWSSGQYRRKSWYVAFANCHGVNTATMTDLNYQHDITGCGAGGRDIHNKLQQPAWTSFSMPLILHAGREIVLIIIFFICRAVVVHQVFWYLLLYLNSTLYVMSEDMIWRILKRSLTITRSYMPTKETLV